MGEAGGRVMDHVGTEPAPAISEEEGEVSGAAGEKEGEEEEAFFLSKENE